MDLCIETPKVEYLELDKERIGKKEEESSEVIRSRVVEARKLQKKRYEGTQIRTNSMLGPGEIRTYIPLGSLRYGMMNTSKRTPGDQRLLFIYHSKYTVYSGNLQALLQ